MRGAAVCGAPRTVSSAQRNTSNVYRSSGYRSWAAMPVSKLGAARRGCADAYRVLDLGGNNAGLVHAALLPHILLDQEHELAGQRR